MLKREQNTTRNLKNRNRRILLVLGVCVYVGSFVWIYSTYLNPVWAYFGFVYHPADLMYMVFACVLGVAPSFWLPLELTRPSHLAYWILYLTVVIPSMIVPLYASSSAPSEVCALMLTIFVGFFITGVSHWFPTIRIPRLRIPGSLFWKCLICFALFLVMWVVVGLGRDLRLVSFLNVYDLRDSASDKFEGSLLNYPLMWLSGAIDPILLACGLYYKRIFVFLVGVFGQLLVYSAIGTKGSILSILFVVAFYILLKIRHVPFALKVVYGGVVVLSAPVLVYSTLAGREGAPLLELLLFVIVMRTFSINGLLTTQYYDFFQHNPWTYYSHVKGVSWFVHYPYANPMGIEVGSFYSGDSTLDATAHFWAMDGLAALGLGGVILISVLCAIVFLVLDSVAERHDPRFSALVVCYTAYNLANIPLFTTLLSGGLGLLILFFWLAPRQNKTLRLRSDDRRVSSTWTGQSQGPLLFPRSN